MDLTIILGFRNRDLERVGRCLDSLRRQSTKSFHVIFVDYGSDSAIAARTETAVAAFDFCDYVYSDTRGYPWNRSQCLNVGIRRAQTAYVMTSDIDIIFADNFVEVLLANVGPDKVVHCVPFMLNQNHDYEQPLDDDSILKLRKGSLSAKGVCQCLSTSVLHKIRGFDEYYRYWGIEDRDLAHRLKTMGLVEQWLNEQNETHMLHQWHPAANYLTAGYIPSIIWASMEDHYFGHQAKIVRNSEDWGRIYASSERELFRYLPMVQTERSVNDGFFYLDLPPYQHASFSEFMHAFQRLPAGGGIAVNHANDPKRHRALFQAFDLLDRASMKITRQPTTFHFRQNILHDCIAFFILNHPNQILDYYVNYPTQDGVTYLLKRESI